MAHLLGEPLRALDLCNGSGASCGRMLSVLGVEVVKVEPPGGDRGRSGHEAGGASDFSWLAYNTGKKSVVIDLTDEEGKIHFLQLADEASFIIESFPPGYLDRLGVGYEVLSQRNPRVILTSISPFGADGPYSNYIGSDITILAMGGLLAQSGEPDRAPLRFSVAQTEPLSGAQAAAAMLIAHESRAQTGVGQHIDLSVQEAVLAADFVQQQNWDILRENSPRTGVFHDRGGVKMRLIFDCADGFISWRLMFGAHGYMTRALVDWMAEENEAGELQKVDWDILDIRTLAQDDVDLYESTVSMFFGQRTKSTLYQGAVERGVVLFPVNTAPDILSEAQLAYRQFWHRITQPLIGMSVRVPDRPFLVNGVRQEEAQLSAPILGEHQADFPPQDKRLFSHIRTQPEVV